MDQFNTDASIDELPPGLNPDDFRKPRELKLGRGAKVLGCAFLLLMIGTTSFYYWVVAPHLLSMGHVTTLGGVAEWSIDRSNWQSMGSTRLYLPMMRRAFQYNGFHSEDADALQGLIHMDELYIQITPDLGLEILPFLPQFPDLVTIEITNPWTYYQVERKVFVTDDDLRLIASAKNLKNLLISDTKITDAGLKHLATMTKLEILDLSGNEITDEKLSDLKPLRNLRSLYLRDTKVTPAGVATLRKILPNLDVIDADSLPIPKLR